MKEKKVPEDDDGMAFGTETTLRDSDKPEKIINNNSIDSLVDRR